MSKQKPIKFTSSVHTSMHFQLDFISWNDNHGYNITMDNGSMSMSTKFRSFFSFPLFCFIDLDQFPFSIPKVKNLLVLNFSIFCSELTTQLWLEFHLRLQKSKHTETLRILSRITWMICFIYIEMVEFRFQTYNHHTILLSTFHFILSQ